MWLTAQECPKRCPHLIPWGGCGGRGALPRVERSVAFTVTPKEALLPGHPPTLVGTQNEPYHPRIRVVGFRVARPKAPSVEPPCHRAPVPAPVVESSGCRLLFLAWGSVG